MVQMAVCSQVGLKQKSVIVNQLIPGKKMDKGEYVTDVKNVFIASSSYHFLLNLLVIYYKQEICCCICRI